MKLIRQEWTFPQLKPNPTPPYKGGSPLPNRGHLFGKLLSYHLLLSVHFRSCWYLVMLLTTLQPVGLITQSADLSFRGHSAIWRWKVYISFTLSAYLLMFIFLFFFFFEKWMRRKRLWPRFKHRVQGSRIACYPPPGALTFPLISWMNSWCNNSHFYLKKLTRKWFPSVVYEGYDASRPVRNI